MTHTDPISDMLTRVRNACQAKHKRVDVPLSAVKLEFAKILLDEKFILNYRVVGEEPKQFIRIFLKYSSEGEPAIIGMKRISKPGLRRYAGCDELQPIHGGLGIAIVSTSKGVLTDHRCKELHVGGEVLAHIW